MRDILFKAKRIDNDEWVEGFLFKMQMDGGYTWCIGEEPLTANDYSEIIGCGRTWFFINHHTLCQYTGLTDKNGNKIWENDIVKCNYNDYGEKGTYIGKVIFREDNCTFIVTDGKSTDYEWWNEEKEVIGNIFDNSELVNRTDF